MSALDNAYEQARARRARVVLPEAGDARIAQAVERLAGEGLAVPVPLAAPSDAHMAAILKQRPGKEAFARRLLEKPLVRAAAMVACGEAEVMVAGVASPTRRVIEAAQFAIGMAEGITLPSSSFLMRFPDGREAIFADCGFNVSPDAVGLADIAAASAATATALLGRAELAFLSFSTLASGAGESVDRVRAATAMAQARGLAAIGPVQADAALNPEIAARKGIAAGAPNVFIFPSLDAGNIAYKLAQELAGAQALGPLLQGFAKPVCDLSRGASVKDIVAATAVTLALAG